MNIVEMLHDHVHHRPDTAAIIDTRGGQARVLSFAGLELASSRAAALLRQAGLRPGDTILVFLPMSAELYVALLAAFRLGLAAMVIDPGQGRAHLERCCRLYPPQALLAGPKVHLLRLVSPGLRRIPVKFVAGRPFPGAVSWRQAGSLAPDPAIYPAAPETPALLTFTSGSTGLPRLAQRSHGFLLAQQRVLAASLELAPGRVDLATMPIVTLANLAAGLTSLIPQADLRFPGRVDPAPIAAQIAAYRVNSIAASPALLDRLARFCLARGLALPGLARIFTGGAPVFPDLLERLRQIAPRAEITAVYGSTEAEPIAKISRCELGGAELRAMAAGRGLLAGNPVEAIRVSILPDRWGQPLGPLSEAEFAALACPVEQPGEIVVSGEHVLAGYLHGEGDRETKFRVGGAVWHRTGDAGYMDRQGRLWLLGRCAARIADERGQLYPFSVEAAAAAWPGVSRAALVGLGNRRILVVEPGDGARFDPAGLKSCLAWAGLDEIRLLKRLPVDRRHNAKIDYPALHRLLGLGDLRIYNSR